MADPAPGTLSQVRFLCGYLLRHKLTSELYKLVAGATSELA